MKNLTIDVANLLLLLLRTAFFTPLVCVTTLLCLSVVIPTAYSTPIFKECFVETAYIGTMGGMDQSGLFQNGLFMVEIDTCTGELSEAVAVAQTVRSTTVLSHPEYPVLYSVSASTGERSSPSNVLSFAVDPVTGELQPTSTQSSGGSGATQLVLDKVSKTLFVANLVNGSVAAFPVLSDGSIAAATSIMQNEGSGPRPRQTGPHAHGLALDPSGQFLLVADIGADRVFIYRFDAEKQMLSPSAPAFVDTSPGSGPRHLVFDPRGRFMFLANEYSSEVYSYSWNSQTGQLQLIQAISTLRADYTGPANDVAEIVVSDDGKTLYLSNRGEDSIVVYRIDGDTGMLTEAQRVPVAGSRPWSFAIDPTGYWMIVTNRESNSVTVLKVDSESGRLASLYQSPLIIPKPVSVTFLNY